MTTLLGPTPCHVCRVPVTVVRRPVVIRGHTSDCRCPHHAPGCLSSESTEMREVVVIDVSGDHACRRV